MKLKILSDLHTEGYNFIYERLDEDVLILAGDIGVGSKCIDWIKNLPKDLPIIFIPGNHEYYKYNFVEMNELFYKKFKNTNVHFLYNSEIIIDDVKFIGGPMWSNFELYGVTESYFAEKSSAIGIMDFHLIKTYGKFYEERPWTTLDCKEEFNKFDKFVKFALKQPFEGKIVVISHFCPSRHSVHPRFQFSSITPLFASDCEHLMGKANLWVHGHTHDSYDYNIEGTRIVCNPKGYGNENRNGFNPTLIVEI